MVTLIYGTPDLIRYALDSGKKFYDSASDKKEISTEGLRRILAYQALDRWINGEGICDTPGLQDLIFRSDTWEKSVADYLANYGPFGDYHHHGIYGYPKSFEEKEKFFEMYLVLNCMQKVILISGGIPSYSEVIRSSWLQNPDTKTTEPPKDDEGVSLIRYEPEGGISTLRTTFDALKRISPVFIYYLNNELWDKKDKMERFVKVID